MPKKLLFIIGSNRKNSFNRQLAQQSHDHHFKWWFDVAPVRGKILAPPKRRVSKADYGRPHNEATILLPYFPYMTPVPDPGCIS